MHSFQTCAALATTFLITLSNAQHDLSTVAQATRDAWCQSQTTSCPLLCLQLPGESSTTAANTCDSNALTYQCICGNGQSPNASEYSQTLPFYICTENNNQCVSACANGDSACQSACRDDHPCGAQNPTRPNSTISSTMSATGSASNSAGQVFSGLGGTSSSSGSSTKNGAQTALDLGQSYGIVVLFAGVFAGFALVL